LHCCTDGRKCAVKEGFNGPERALYLKVIWSHPSLHSFCRPEIVVFWLSHNTTICPQVEKHPSFNMFSNVGNYHRSTCLRMMVPAHQLCKFLHTHTHTHKNMYSFIE
jgi:hypothetical protein